MKNEFLNCMSDTLRHIKNVRKYINKLLAEIELRKDNHDSSKLEYPEFEIFVEYTPKLKNLTYLSKEYEDCRAEMKTALDHHYANNRHHPEHFENGIHDMNLVDLIELICDWKASSLRHDDGDILESIEKNQNRFGYSDELKQILINTVKLLEDER